MWGHCPPVVHGSQSVALHPFLGTVTHKCWSCSGGARVLTVVQTCQGVGSSSSLEAGHSFRHQAFRHGSSSKNCIGQRLVTVVTSCGLPSPLPCHWTVLLSAPGSPSLEYVAQWMRTLEAPILLVSRAGLGQGTGAFGDSLLTADAASQGHNLGQQ